MRPASRRLAGILLVLFPTVIYGGVMLLGMIVAQTPGYLDNPVRRDLWRAGHAHGGVLLILSLVVLRYVDEANMPDWMRGAVRTAAPIAAILIPVAYFLSIADPSRRTPNDLIYLAYAGAVVLTLGLFALGVGLLRAKDNS
jgi:drug/metabolite transporter superfamily protein YnfA